MNKVPQDFLDYINSSPLVKKNDDGKGRTVLKYKNKVFYDNLWDDYLEECRGLIIDQDGNIIQMPFRKIYNFGIEYKAPNLPDDTVVSGYKKVNGFMAAISVHNDELIISTTGSTTSTFVQFIKDKLTTAIENMVASEPNYTFLFECVHEQDPHIIEEIEGLHLLAKREKRWGSIVEHFTYKRDFLGTLGALRKKAKDCDHEGFVFYTKDGTAAKLKSPYYLTKKFLARSNISKLTHAKAKEFLSEEYYPLVDNIKENLDLFKTLDEQQKLNYIREFLG